jgi:hypothetical protein
MLALPFSAGTSAWRFGEDVMASPGRRPYLQKRVGVLRARLNADLAATETEAFLQLVWAIGILQSDEPGPAKPFLRFPPQAMTDNFASPYAVRAWELETLANLVVQTAKSEGPATLACGDFNNASRFINALRNLENVESGAYLEPGSIFKEMHRIGQRQFPWQRGYVHNPDVYRSIYLYGQEGGATFFEQRHGLSLEAFTKTGFALFAALANRPTAQRTIDLGELGVPPETLALVLDLIALPADQARDVLAQTVNAADALDLPTAYKPSLLRRWPILSFGPRGERLRAPLPALVLQRITAGLYYDLLAAGGGLRDEIARRFETYCMALMRAALPRLAISPEYRYPRGGAADQIDSPDILLSDQKRLTLAIECKATKLTFAAQFADEPSVAAASKYDELGKGVFQLWRYFSHCRRGLTRHDVDDDTCGLILTVDTWLVMSRELQQHVMDNARQRAAAEPGMTAEDQRPVNFAAIQDFERLVLQTDEAGFFRTLAAAKEERFLGWLLPDIRRDNEAPLPEPKPYPFDLGDLLVWWGEFNPPSSA